MSNDNVSTWNKASRVLPTRTTENALVQPRASRYGEAYQHALIGDKLHAVADEAAYFTATNATPGTAIAGIAAADGYDVTETLFYLHVRSTATKRVYMDYLSLTAAVAGANGTNFSLAITTDNTARYTSGGTSITPVAGSQFGGVASSVDAAYFGAVVTTAASANGKLLWHSLLRTVIKVIGDQYVLSFGAPEEQGASMPTAGTLQLGLVRKVPPVVLNPGDTLMVHEYAASQSGAAEYQFAAGWWER